MGKREIIPERNTEKRKKGKKREEKERKNTKE